MPWADFEGWLTFNQGEHVTLLGPTQSGKTTLAFELVPRRDWSIILATKQKDPRLTAFEKQEGYLVVRSWPPPPNVRRVLLWPRMRRVIDVYASRDVFREALEGIYLQGGWCVYVDELLYLVKTLRLSRPLEVLWQQGATLGVTVIAGSQRPAWVPLEAYSQATHLFIWRTSDRRDLARLADVAGQFDVEKVRRTVAQLALHECLYANTRRGTLMRTRVGG